MNDLQKRATALAQKIELFQEGTLKCLKLRDNFKQKTGGFSWANIPHLSQDEPGLLVAAILFFVARVEQEIERVSADWDGKTFSLPFAEGTILPESLVTLQSEYGSSVRDALTTLRRRALNRYGYTIGDSDEPILSREVEDQLDELKGALSDLMEHKLVPALMRLRNESH